MKTASCIVLLILMGIGSLVVIGNLANNNISSIDSYVAYTPVVLDGVAQNDLYRAAPELNTTEHQRAVAAVLRAYDQRYEFRDGTLYIPRELAADIDLLMNFTEKALEAQASSSDN